MATYLGIGAGIMLVGISIGVFISWKIMRFSDAFRRSIQADAPLGLYEDINQESTE